MKWSPELHQRVSAIVEQALELPASERAKFLDSACAGDTVLRAEAESLLAHEERVPSGFLARPILGPNEPPAVETVSLNATVDFPSTPTEPDKTLPLVPGYEIVKILGRGGMGIVYLARDLTLPRQVALKMIRSGVDADEKTKRRFKAEAEAVAKLQHPNIVQIHQIGEHAGNPYVALEFVNGGTLAHKINGKAMPADAAAQIVMVLAKAVQVVHQLGIIHRDLKPANVLVTPDGTPKITDFGLAKQLDADQALSQTGDIMGTPSYMAPEQAFGKIQDIGPGTDVYALGTILYEALTGRVPFKGESTLETLEQVRHQEPVAPRKHQPSLPRDLETICLKCLRKEPKDRYTSALALAQDLERYLAGEAILARPEGVLARGVRTLRRNRAASLATVAVLLIALTAAAYLAYRGGRQGRVDEIEDRLKVDRDKADWTDAKIQEHEALIEKLASVAPERAEQARGNLILALIESGNLSLKSQGVLQPEAKTHVERMIGELRKRDPDKATQLEGRYQTRLRDYLLAFQIAAPKKTDLEKQSFSSQPKPPDTLLTREICKGNVQLEGVWNTWQDASQVGLTLHGDADNGTAGYAFLLEAIPAAGKASFGGVRQVKEARVQFRILRNGVLLKQEILPITQVPNGPIRLTAQREDDRLHFFLEKRVVVVARDLVPLAPRGFFGVVLGENSTMIALTGRQQSLPVKPGKLEEGDELFVQGKFTDAQTYYAKQANDLLGTADGLEARFKESLALENLKQEDKAIRGYQALLNEAKANENNQWVFLAIFQLWVHELRHKNLDVADVMFTKLMSMKKFAGDKSLMLFIPEEIRSEILKGYRDSSAGLGFWRPDPNRLRNAQRVVEVEALLEVGDIYRGWSQKALLRVLRSEGGTEEAVRLVQEWLKNIPDDDELFGVLFTMEFGWLMREQKTPHLALAEVNRRLIDKNGGAIRPTTRPLLLERARVYVAIGNMVDARKDLIEFVKDVSEKEYRLKSDAYLMLGMVEEVLQNPNGAMTAWREGKYKGNINDPNLTNQTAGGIGLINLVMLDGLCRDLDEKRLEGLVRNTLRTQPELIQALNRFDAKGVFRTGAAIGNRMWYTPRGKNAARRMVMQDCSFEDFFRLPYQVLAVELLNEEALAEPITEEQEKILWKLSEDGFEGFSKGKVTQLQLLELGLIWKRGPLPLFGVVTLKGLDPGLRGPASYFMGLRFQRMSLAPAQVEEVFRIALANAPEGSALRRLTQIELGKLTPKKTP